MRGWGERTLPTAIALVLSASLRRRTPAPRLLALLPAAACAAGVIAPANLSFAVLLFPLALPLASLAISICVVPVPAAPLLGHHHETVLSVEAASGLGEARVLLIELPQPLDGHLFPARAGLPPHLRTKSR